MLAPTLPVEENARMLELRELMLLDTGNEERFDRITRLAAQVFDVPFALFSLVDNDRQWFKSRVGVNMCQSSRETSFCGHAILQDQPLVVEDASLDPRFADNPLVTGDMHIRFYAGQPIRGPKGFKVGTLCVLDTVPRPFSEDDLETLSDLAAVIEKELELTDMVELQKNLIDSQQNLIQSREKLAAEVQEAAQYVCSLMPPPLEEPIRARVVYYPSSELGGDSVGYRWLDEERFLIFSIDVSGHGIGSALLSVSMLHAIRGITENEYDPGKVMTELNRVFHAANRRGQFCSVWIGIYNRKSGKLSYSSAGHPPPLLIRGSEPSIEELAATEMILGVVPDVEYQTKTVPIHCGDRLLIFSDGIYEVEGPQDMKGTYGEFHQLVSQLHPHGTSLIDSILATQRSKQGLDSFVDDVSMMEFAFLK